MTAKLTFSLSVVIFFSSCGDQKPVSRLSTNTYYNIDSLLDTQLVLLSRKQSKLSKEQLFKDYKEQITLEMDSIQWAQALSVFRALDLNKPSLKNAYKIIDQVPDTSSNLTILQYKLKEEDGSRIIKELNFYYLDSILRLKKITAKSESNGYIYGSAKSYELTFDQHLEETWLEKYIIKVDQKTLFQDSLKTTVEFEIKH